MDEAPPHDDGHDREAGPLYGVEPAQAISVECACRLPPTRDQTARDDQRHLEM